MANGSVNCEGTHLDAQCTFKCDVGYTLNGRSNAICRAPSQNSNSAGWTSLPTCVPRKCTAEPTILHGKITSCTGSGYMDKCYIRCNDGYANDGNIDHITCSENNDWTRGPICRKQPKCLKVNLDLTVMNVKCTSGRDLGSVCTFSCPADEGFKLNNGFKVFESTCEGSMINSTVISTRWSHAFPKCTSICPEFNASPGLSRTCLDEMGTGDYTSEGSKCDFECANGYKLSGAKSLTCENKNLPVLIRPSPSFDIMDSFNVIISKNITKSVWSAETPRCKQITCPRIPGITNGSVKCTGYMFGDVCAYSCDPGYEMDFEKELVNARAEVSCTEIGRWSARMPRCHVMKIHSTPPPILSQPQIIPARVPSRKQPISAVESCKPLETGILGLECDNGRLVGSRCQFKCPHGYKIDGNEFTSCYRARTAIGSPVWSTEKLPSCLYTVRLTRKVIDRLRTTEENFNKYLPRMQRDKSGSLVLPKSTEEGFDEDNEEEFDFEQYFKDKLEAANCGETMTHIYDTGYEIHFDLCPREELKNGNRCLKGVYDTVIEQVKDENGGTDSAYNEWINQFDEYCNHAASTSSS